MCGFDGTFEGLSNHNVPEGPSDKPYAEARRAEFDGMGWDGMNGWDGISKVSFNFLHTL